MAKARRLVAWSKDDVKNLRAFAKSRLSTFVLRGLKNRDEQRMKGLKPQAQLFRRIREIWESARAQAARSVNTAHVCANWLIGEQIVQAEQGGAKRAGYGMSLLKTLSAQLADEYVKEARWNRTFDLDNCAN